MGRTQACMYGEQLGVDGLSQIFHEQHQVQVIDRRLLETIFLVKAPGILIDDMDQNGPDPDNVGSLLDPE